MYNIMIIEDDETLRKLIAEHLTRYNYKVYLVEEFENILYQFNQIKPDIMLLDINLPYYDGFHICKLLRRKSNIPIIIVSARNGSTDQVLGLEAGADDYITKPVNLETLLSKIKAILRRTYGEYASNRNLNLKVKDLLLDEGSFKMNYKSHCIELSKNEFRLIKKLMENRDTYVLREELLAELWDDISFVDDNTLSVNVKRIKDRFEAFGVFDLIKTKRGVGYMLDTSILEGRDDEENLFQLYT